MRVYQTSIIALIFVVPLSGCNQTIAVRDVRDVPVESEPDPSSEPIALPDTTAPTISEFAIPATGSSLAVAISSFSATDNTAVTGYCVTTSAASTDCSWSSTAPSSVTFSNSGSQTAYAWAKDAAGNVSLPKSASISLQPLGSVPVVPSTAIFADDFDAQDDWAPMQSQSGLTNSCAGIQSCSTPIPNGYSDYRIAAAEGCSNLDGNHNTLNINRLHPRGAEGKSFMMWSEPCYSSGGSWGSDGLLGVAFPGQNEVYVRYWIQFSPNWLWSNSSSSPISPMQKFIHLSHYDETDPGSVWDFFSGTQNKPRHVGGLAKYGTGTYRTQLYMMHSPLTANHDGSATFTTNSYLGPSPLDWKNANAPGDGNWHSFEWYVKLNSAGGVGDGQSKFWYDGNLVQSETNVVWIPAGETPGGRQWNHVWLGGNNANLYLPAVEQWYAVDDFVISTHYSGPPPAPVSVQATSTTAGTAHLSWSPGNNGSNYLLSAYRVYYGTSPGNLDKSVTLGSDLSGDIIGLASAQQYYFQVTAVKQASYDSNESESLRSASASVLVK